MVRSVNDVFIVIRWVGLSNMGFGLLQDGIVNKMRLFVVLTDEIVNKMRLSVDGIINR